MSAAPRGEKIAGIGLSSATETALEDLAEPSSVPPPTRFIDQPLHGREAPPRQPMVVLGRISAARGAGQISQKLPDRGEHSMIPSCPGINLVQPAGNSSIGRRIGAQ